MENYYRISEKDLGTDAKIPILKLENSQKVFLELAMEMFDEIKKNNELNKRTVFICPVGPIGHYPLFVDLVNENKLDLKKVWFFNMDEYLEADGEWIDKNHRLSFRGFMEREVYEKIDKDLLMPESQRIFPDPKAPNNLDKLLEELGGADICFGGIGINGHLAFNEPQENLNIEEFSKLGSRMLNISAETLVANAIGDLGGAIEAMPNLCVTIGMKQILSAKKIRLAVFRDWHRAVVRRAAYGEVSTSFPVSLVQNHKDTKIIVNDIAVKAAIS